MTEIEKPLFSVNGTSLVALRVQGMKQARQFHPHTIFVVSRHELIPTYKNVKFFFFVFLPR